ncbi:MAG: NAD-dependent deacylase [Pseudomonadota bacterium]
MAGQETDRLAFSASATKRIVILTGAGISAESGLGTFRDAGGLWSSYDLAEVATPEGYAANPALVLDFYNARRANCRAAAPNAAHRALARLAARHPGEVTLITQNIDDLHERGGTQRVHHMHGEVMRAFCSACDTRRPVEGDLSLADRCGACGATGQIRPDVVWFGEVPYGLEMIGDALAAADLFVAIGTSGAVYPAAGFVTEAARHGAGTLELNLERSEISGLFDRRRLGPATETVPAWVDEILGETSG